jgi:hypothetical protein
MAATEFGSEARKVAIGKFEDCEPAAETGQKLDETTSSRLTTCEVIENGDAVRLGFLDQAGKPASVEFPFDQAESIVMTLPKILSMALQLRMRDQAARFVFPLGRWSIESGDKEFLIANLMTNDGFQVSFAVPFDACKAIGWSLFHEGQAALQERDERSLDEHATFN